MTKDCGDGLPLVDLVPEGGEPFYYEVHTRDLWEVADLDQ